MAAEREQIYISEVRALNKQVWDGLNALKAKQSEWNALDYGSQFEKGGNGPNDGISGADVGAVVFATTDALLTVLATGHATNMAKLL
jgi:hypothetical protein